jgi:hypothetical protein
MLDIKLGEIIGVCWNERTNIRNRSKNVICFIFFIF